MIRRWWCRLFGHPPCVGRRLPGGAETWTCRRCGAVSDTTGLGGGTYEE